MSVVMQAVGSPVAATTGTLTVAWPAHATNDIGLLFLTSSAGGTTETLSTANGFTLINTYSTGSGTAGVKISVYWARATSAAMASPIVTAGSDFKYGIIITYRGAITSTSPINVTTGGVKATASTSVSVSTITPTISGCYYVFAVAHDLDSGSSFLSGTTNSNIGNITLHANGGSTNGSGGGIAVGGGDLPRAIATGATTATVTSSVNAFLVLALTPQPATAITNTFEGGTNTVAISAGNSGGASGTAITSTASNAGTTMTYTNEQVRGTIAYKSDFAIAAAGYLVWSWVTTARTAVRYYFYMKDFVPNDYMEISRLRNASATNGQLSVSAESFVVYWGSGSFNIPVKPQANTWYRIEMAVTTGSTTSNGRVEFAFYDSDSTSLIHYYDTGFAVNTGTTGQITFRLGSSNGPATTACTFYYDDLAIQELETGFIGPSGTPTTYDRTQFMPFF